jgi:hypothetical protein|tara:strand:+ start:291 stop:569 length:279 start_codon:yes stop_codon:yes gene_type:complete
MIDIKEITVGQSYGCKFRVSNVPLDEFGCLGGPLSLADLPIKEYGEYEGFGFLKQRDTEQELVVVIDEKSDNEFVCAYTDIWDVDEVELIEG